MQRRGRGTHRIPRADQTAAAAKPISAAPAVTGFSIALQLNSPPVPRPGRQINPLARSALQATGTQNAPAAVQQPLHAQRAHVAERHRRGSEVLRAFGAIGHFVQKAYDALKDCPTRRHIKAGRYVSTC